MKKLIAFALFAGLAAAAPGATAQTRPRFALKPARGESGRAVAGRVAGTLAGDAYREYYFAVPAGRSADIAVTTDAGARVVFDLIAPRGRKLYENVEDLLDELPSKGVYTIRVYRRPEAGERAGRSRFQLAVFMYL